MTVPLHTTVRCLAGCGVLGEGSSGDPPRGRKVRANWTRLDELDALAEKHAKTHAVASETEPGGRR